MSTEESLRFFAVPATALRGIWDELRLSLDETKAKELIYRYGRRTGEGYAYSLAIRAQNYAEASVSVSHLVAEIGLGRVKINHTDNEMNAIFAETLESSALKGSRAQGCFFTSGAIAGLISIVLGKRHESVEEQCLGKGDRRCMFRVYPVGREREEGDVERTEPIREAEAEKLLTDLGLDRGVIFLTKEGNEETYDVLSKVCSINLPGMFITRDFPKKVIEKFKFRGKILWLSKTGESDTIKAPDLAHVLYEIQSFLDKNEDTYIIISGVEYMVTNFGFSPFLKFIQLVAEQVALNDALCFMIINPEAFEKKQLANIARETIFYPLQD